MNRAGMARATHASFNFFPAFSSIPGASSPCKLDGISMNIQEENSARYFRVLSEREQTSGTGNVLRMVASLE